MAKTFGELILEYQNYEYSKENYELTKECYEIQLMAQYLESCQFRNDNLDEIREEYNEFNESYFVEGASGDNIDAIYESFSKKVDKVFKKIGKAIKRIWKNICNFFNKYILRNKKTSDKIKDVFEDFNALPAAALVAALGLGAVGAYKHSKNKNSEDAPKEEPKEPTKAPAENNKLKAILDDAWKDEYTNDGYIITCDQPFASHIRKDVLNQKAHKAIRNMLAVAMSDSTVVVRTDGKKKIISLEDLIAAFDHIIKNPNDFKDAKEYIDHSLKTVASKGLVINVDSDDMENTKKKLEEINSKMEELMTESVDGEDDGFVFTEAKYDARAIKKFEQQIKDGMDNPAIRNYIQWKNFNSRNQEHQKNVADGVTGVNEVYSNITVIAGNMIKLYSNIQAYRMAVATKLEEYLKTTSTSKLTEAAESEE